MKIAFIRAGFWFFGAIFAFIFLFGISVEEALTQDYLLTLLLVGILAAGLIFFMTWYDTAKEERELEMEERRRKMLRRE